MDGIQPRHGFQVVVEHVGPGVGDNFHGAWLAQEVGCQNLDRGVRGGGAQRADGRREMAGTAVGQVVAIHRGDDDMLQAEPGHGVGDPRGLAGVQRERLAGAYVAERAGAGAGVAHDHHGGVALRPALADVGAGGFLADRVQAVFAHQGAGLVVDRMGGRLHPDPGGLALDRVVRAVRLLRVAEGGFGTVVDDEVAGHGGLEVAGGAGGVKPGQSGE